MSKDGFTDFNMDDEGAEIDDDGFVSFKGFNKVNLQENI